MRKKPPLWLLSFALFPMGLGALIPGIAEIRLGRRSLRWPVVQGVILSSRLGPRELGPDQPEIRYIYNVEGKPHVSNRIWPGEVLNSLPVLQRSTAEGLLKRFPMDQGVPVYVDPADSDRSAILPGPSRANLWMGVLLFFLAVGLWSPFALGRFERRAPDA